MFLNKVTLVLALQVDTPRYREFELLARCLKYLDAFGIRQTHEIVVDNEVKAFDKALVVHLVEEFNIVLGIFKGVFHTELNEVLGKVHIIGNIVEGYLRLHHPEFGEVARSV